MLRIRLVFLLFLALGLNNAKAQLEYISWMPNIQDDDIRGTKVIPAGKNGWYTISLREKTIVRHSACGSILWSKSYEISPKYTNRWYDAANSGTGLVLCGYYELTNANGTVIDQIPYVLKIDNAGNVYWSKSYNGGNDQVATSISVAKDGSIFLYGSTSVQGLKFILKGDSVGNVLWSKRFNSTDNVLLTWITATRDGGVVGTYGSRLFKMNAKGDFIWKHRFDNMYAFNGHPVETPDGYVIAAKINASETRSMLIRVDQNGDIKWSSKGFRSSRFPLCVISDGATGFHVAANYLPPNANRYSINLVNINAQGDLAYSHVVSLADANNNRGIVSSICLPQNSNSPVIGGFKYAQNNPNAPGIGFTGRTSDSLAISCLDTSFDVSANASNIQRVVLPLDEDPKAFTTAALKFTSTSLVLSQSIVCSTNSGTPLSLKLNLGPDIEKCATASATLANTGDVFDSYSWSTGATTPSIKVFSGGTYILSGYSACLSDTVRDTIIVKISDAPASPLSASYTVCSGGSIVLDATMPGADTYQWSGGAATPTFEVTASGTYDVTVGFKECIYTYSSVVTRNEVPKLVFGDSVKFCDNVVLDATVNGASAYRWQDGSTAPTFTISEQGTYTVTVSVKGCDYEFKTQTISCDGLEMPNNFTPNNDGINDRFVPIKYAGIRSAHLKVFNRVGRIVFETDNVPQGWDGVLNNGSMISTTFFWVVEYEMKNGNKDIKKGFVELFK